MIYHSGKHTIYPSVIKRLDQVEQYLKFFAPCVAPSQTLLCWDVDETLLLSDDAEPDYIECVAKEMPNILARLKSQGFLQLALTARPAEYITITHRQLTNLNLSMMSFGSSQTIGKILSWGTHQHPLSYYKGILQVGRNNKASSLMEAWENLFGDNESAIRHIVIIDNDKSQVDSIQHFFNNDMPVVGSELIISILHFAWEPCYNLYNESWTTVIERIDQEIEASEDEKLMTELDAVISAGIQA